MIARTMTPEAIAAELADGDVLLFTGDATLMVPDALLAAVETRYLKTGSPAGLTIVQPCNACLGPGTGIDRLAHKGLLRSLITSILPPFRSTKIAALIGGGEIEVTLLPMGVLYSIVREAAAGRPGLLTTSGAGTFVERYIDRDILFGRGTKKLVSRISVDGVDTLLYRSLHADVCFLRATGADARGNLSFEREPLSLDGFSLALLARASNGKTFAQVTRRVRNDTVDPRAVLVPAALVDGVAVVRDAAQSSSPAYDPGLANEIRVADPDPRPLDLLQLLPVRRVLEAFRPGDVINLGVGIGALAPLELMNLGLSGSVTFATEHGAYGGIPSSGDTFGAHYNAEALINPSEMFAMFTGGALTHTVLGFAQADRAGNVNVSDFGGRTNGAGGFIDISSFSRSILFCGTFTAKGLRVDRTSSGVAISGEGEVPKFVERVDEVTFSGDLAAKRGQSVAFITERCVLQFVSGRWSLTEVAPGIDPAADVLARIPFPVDVAEQLRVWPKALMSESSDQARAHLVGHLHGHDQIVRPAFGRVVAG